MQYADDAVLVSRDQKCAQGLASLFDSWCSWAKMDIRLDKCCTFGMIKRDTMQVQILPNLSIKSGQIPAVPIGGNFKYLGKIFDFSMNNDAGKTELLSKVEQMLQTISNLHVNPQTRLKILDRFVPSQIAFYFKIYDISTTWVSEKLDSLCIRRVRNWIEAPISSCISEWLVLPGKKCGMGIASFKNRFERQRLSKRSAMKNSNNENIKDLWQESARQNLNINPDSLIINYSVTEAKKVLIKSQQQSAENHLFGLSYQGSITKIITENIPGNYVNDWTNTINKLPGFLFNFTRKAMQQQLPTLTNLVRWGKATNSQCPHCSLPQTNKHVLSNCANPDTLQRFTARHDKILEIIANWFQLRIANNVQLFADLNNSKFKQCLDLFTGLRPDLAFIKDDTVQVVELTVCHETNIISSKAFKINKYKSLDKHKTSLIEHHNIKVNTCEVTVLGFLSIDPEVLKFLNIDKCDSTFREALTKSALQSSFDIYMMRNS
jgi:hypothetical protein